MLTVSISMLGPAIFKIGDRSVTVFLDQKGTDIEFTSGSNFPNSWIPIYVAIFEREREIAAPFTPSGKYTISK